MIPTSLINLICDCLSEYKLRKFVLDKYNKSEIEWLSGNPNDGAIDLLFKNQYTINWRCLSGNPNDRAIDFLLKNPSKIHWSWLSTNPNDRAVDFLLKNPSKILWVLFIYKSKR